MAKPIKVSCEEIANMVIEHMVVGADEKFLKKLAKTAKGGGKFGQSLATKDKTYGLYVGSPLFFFMKPRDVLFTDETDNKAAYELNDKKEWPKFYELVTAAIQKEQNK